MSRPLSAAERVCREAGLSVDEVCREARISRQRFLQYARHGAPLVAQQRLARVFGNKINHLIFVIGDERYQRAKALQALSNRQAGESRGASQATGGRSGDAARRRQRSNILELVP